MKIEFIREPPLKKVIIELHFNKNFELKVSETAELFNKIKYLYPNEPTLGLVPPRGQKFELHLSALRFSDNENEKSIEIGQNFIILTTIKYSRWENLRNETLDILFELCEILKFDEISNVFITYIDEFEVEKKKEFIFEDYFNIILQKAGKWDIDFSDFHLGLVPFRENNKKIVLRIRSTKDLPEIYKFSVETVFISRSNKIKFERETLTKFLDYGHDKINSYFAQLIYNTLLHNKIGMKVQE
jgi:uncharacterized protein (TIGR04255 family)